MDLAEVAEAADLAVEDRREALAADRAPVVLADLIITIRITIIPTDISGDPAGAGVGAGDLIGVADRTSAEDLLLLSCSL